MDVVVSPARPLRRRAVTLSIAAAGLVVAAVLIARKRSALANVWVEVRRAETPWLLVAIGLSLLLLMSLGLLHVTTQRAAGAPVPVWRAVRLASWGHVLNMVSKSGGMAGMAPFLADAQRARRSRGQTVAGYVLATVLADVAFAVTLAVGIVVMWADGRLTRNEAVALAAFLVLLVARLTTIAAAMRSETAIRRLYRIAGRISAVVRRRPPDLAHQDVAVAELREAVAVLRRRPSAAVPGALCALAVEAVGIAMLAAVLAAVHGPEGLAVPIVAYAISVMFAIIGFLPGGLGFVEVSLGAVLVSFDCPTDKAAAAVALYRVAELWVPAVLGLLASRGMRAR